MVELLPINIPSETLCLIWIFLLGSVLMESWYCFCCQIYLFFCLFSLSIVFVWDTNNMTIICCYKRSISIITSHHYMLQNIHKLSNTNHCLKYPLHVHWLTKNIFHSHSSHNLKGHLNFFKLKNSHWKPSCNQARYLYCNNVFLQQNKAEGISYFDIKHFHQLLFLDPKNGAEKTITEDIHSKPFLLIFFFFILNLLCLVKPKINKDRKKNTHLGRNFITTTRAMREYALDISDLIDLRKFQRRSPYNNEPPITVYLRKDVETKFV